MKTELTQIIRELSAPLDPQPTGVEPVLSRLSGIRAVLLDVYGTLFISGSGDVGVAEESRNRDAFLAALDRGGFSCPDLESAGRGLDAFFTELRGEQEAKRRAEVQHPEVEIREVWSKTLAACRERGWVEGEMSPDAVAKVAVDYECRVNPVWPMPGAAATLEQFKERGTTLGIVSNAQFFTPLLFEALFGADPAGLGFDPALCAWSYELREAKPSTRLFEEVAESLETLPGEALYVGNDMLNDIWTAQQVGFRTALFAGDRRSLRQREDDPRCRDLRPDAVVTELPQVLQLL